MNILCIGDIFGKPGRRALKELLPRVIEEHKIDFVVINGENAAGGKGISDKVAEELFKNQIDVITAGNHIWEHKSIHPYFSTHPILRPLNVADVQLPGRGQIVVKAKNGCNVGVICLQGELFMDDKGPKVVNPFKVIEEPVRTLREIADIIVVDMHAETTSEKRAMAWFLDGRVTALVGTHTHVQTSDEEILPDGTAFITDLGMTGPHDSVIGLDKQVALKRFLTGELKGYEVAKGGARLEGVVIVADEKTGKATAINRIRIRL
ncbi:MAG: metallophosphoesterase [Deltaproteobacteria bacterium RIFCSPLOWO2_02_FULL_47_10]|nr:MAG: metallophosphoesterase [Deltaproteobacteria bacterium RIFCSPLOWO2_02_FULL_47_10]